MELTPRVSLRALSYRVLCHAEIEHYLEDRALEVSAAVSSAWKERGHISRPTFCLLAFSGRSLAALPDTLKAPNEQKRKHWVERIKPDKRLASAIAQYTYNVVKQNNGVKEANLISLLLPIGYDADLFDEVLIADLNDLGVKRGEAAHASTSGQVSRGVNPQDEYEHVQRIISGLLSIDVEIAALLRNAQ